MASNKIRNHPDAKRSADGIQVRASALVVADGWNVRTRDAELEAHIEGIKKSLLGGGKIPSLQVYVGEEDQIIIVDGHCRNEAIQRAIVAGAEIEWVNVVEFEGNDADRVAFMFTSSQGKALSQYEQAEAFKRLRGFGWSAAEIATRVGKSKGFIDKMLLLANADSEVKRLVKTGKVSANAAVATVRKGYFTAADVLGRKIKAAQDRADSEPRRKGLATPQQVRITEKDLGSKKLPKNLQEQLNKLILDLPASTDGDDYATAVSLTAATPDQLVGEQVWVTMDWFVRAINMHTTLAKALKE